MRFWVIVLVATAIPACADTRFRITIMPRPELAAGKAQCDIRLEIDNEVEITIRRDQVAVRTLSGQDARDDGSDCTAPLPAAEMPNFTVQTVDSRSDIRILHKPTPQNDFALVVRILDAAPGFGRYRFRLAWDTASQPTADFPKPPRNDDTARPPAPDGFSWNNAVTYRGHGGGVSILNGQQRQPLADVRVDIDLGGKIIVSFARPKLRGGGRGGPRLVLFNGTVTSRTGARIQASMLTEDHRLQGAMNLSVDGQQNVNSITLRATDGQDHLTLTWDRQ